MSRLLVPFMVMVLSTGVADAADHAVPEASRAGGASATATITTSALTCRTVGDRWRLCGDASRTTLGLGVGIRFYRVSTTGALTAASVEHETCAAALADASIPQTVRVAGLTQCGRMLAESHAGSGRGNRLLVDPAGTLLSYTTLTPVDRTAIDLATLELTAQQPGPYTLGCAAGPAPGGFNCWGFGYLCAAYFKDDGTPAVVCSECTNTDVCD